MSTKKSSKHSLAEAPQSFADHLGELRTRLTWMVVIFIAMSAIAYSFRDILVHFVLSPIGDQKLVYLTPGGGFSFIFQIILYTGLLLTTPFIIYHLYRFVAPALPHEVHGMGIRIVFASTLLMLFGAGFGYFFAVPAALQFLEGFAVDFVQANLTADSYFNFLVAYVLGLGLLFQLPLLLVLWNWISPLPPGRLLNTQQYVLVGSFIAAALITPTPDIYNQVMVAAPIIVVYQFGVIAVYSMNRNHRRRTQVTPAVRTENIPKSVSPIFSTELLEARPVESVAQVVSHVRKGSTSIQSKAVMPKSMDGMSIARTRVQPVKVTTRPQPVKLSTPNRPAHLTLRRTHVAQTSIDGFSFYNAKTPQ